MQRHTKMLLGVAIGAAAGFLANILFGGAPWVDTVVEYIAAPIGNIFLRLLFVLVVPLLFSALVMGICELDVRHLGRMGLRMLGYTVVISSIAVVIGLTLVNTVQPGKGMDPEQIEQMSKEKKLDLDLSTSQAQAGEPDSWVDVIVDMFPTNPISAMAEGDMLGLIVFSLFFGLGVAMTQTKKTESLRDVIEGLYDVMMKLIDAVIGLAPIGVGALLFMMGAELGFDILGVLFWYVAVVLAGLAIHMVVVYSLSVMYSGMSPLRFFRDVRLATVTAFSTSSSSATLPIALEVADRELKLPDHVSRFVLTAGSAMNQNGTALFEGVTVLFLAQLYGVPLDLGQQAMVMIICILGGIGTAGVPGGSIPVIALILARFNIPVAGLGLILGIDRILDMCRTALNVTGDLAAAVYVAKGEPHDPAANPTTETSAG